MLTKSYCDDVTQEQCEEIEAAVRVSVSKLTFGDARRIMGSLATFTEDISSVLHKARPRARTFPKENELFELSLGEKTVGPRDILESQGWGKEREWKPQGPSVIGPQTGKFRLVRAGKSGQNPFYTIEELRDRLGGNMAEVEWCEAFRQQYLPPTKPPFGFEDTTVGFCGSHWGNPELDEKETFLTLESRGFAHNHTGVWKREISQITRNCIMFEYYLWLQRVA